MDSHVSAQAHAYADNLSGAPYDLLKARGLMDTTIKDALLGYVPRLSGERFSDCITIPYHDGKGRVRAIRYRPMYESKAKYLYAAGQRIHLYNVEAVRNRAVYLCEGEFDTLILRQLDFPAVGVPGTNAMQDKHEYWKWLFFGSEVYVCFDGDDAGQKAARQVARMLDPIASDVRILEFPAEHDVNSLFLEDPEELISLLEAGAA